jgi:predicted nucleic acid-binding Zn ribbon protein
MKMTDGKIWEIMLKLKAFTPWMVLKELNPPKYLKQYAKEKIRSLIASQVKAGILQVLNEDPPVFGFPEEDVEKVMRKCGICGRKFIPTQHSDQYCSDECEKEYRKRFLERMRREKGMEERRRYQPWEEEIIWETLSRNGCKSAILQELGKRLNRHPEAIKSKFKKMRQRTKSRR